MESMSKEIRIPEDLWFFVGRELRSRGFITNDVLVRAMIEEPKVKWLLLEKEEWKTYRSNSSLVDLNPIEHAKETERELEQWEATHNIFVNETVEQFPEIETLLRENGWTEFDNVILMSKDRTEDAFREADEACLRYYGKPFYYTVDSCRLAFFIHELIHAYEKRLGKTIIRDTLETESILQNEILFRYLNSHSLQPKDFRLSYSK